MFRVRRLAGGVDMTGRYTITGSDNWTPRQNQSEVARQQMHGPIVPMTYPEVPLWRRIMNWG